MMRTLIVLVTIASVRGATVNDADCTTDIKSPTDTLQSFSISQKDTIAAGTACVWGLKSTEHRSVELRLEVASPNTNAQCIKVSYTGSTEPATESTICGEEGKNVFTADAGKNITVTYEAPKEATDIAIRNFQVYYQLVNDNRCSDAPNPPTDKTQSFSVAKSVDTIPTGLLCSWSLPTTDGKKIRVALDVDSTKTENQCVTVADADKTKASLICGKEQENTYVSSGKDVVITYGEQDTGKTAVANFEIHYQFVNSAECTTDVAKPTDKLQSFDVSQKDTITAGTTCTWGIASTEKKSLQLSLELNPPDTNAHCVKVSETGNTGASGESTICGEEGKNLFTADAGKNIIVTYEGPVVGEGIKDFQVYYQLERKHSVYKTFVSCSFKPCETAMGGGDSDQFKHFLTALLRSSGVRYKQLTIVNHCKND
ncbi:unnamed protein product [Echinostoma caproni]|uniref:CUB domain-containing protein n=1 Tax=Echinostoma caproni TaxID=27848 RepID=A0A183AJG3_9TREM|nr:unnamed protein product [Echinostoma caproni]